MTEEPMVYWIDKPLRPLRGFPGVGWVVDTSGILHVSMLKDLLPPPDSTWIDEPLLPIPRFPGFASGRDVQGKLQIGMVEDLLPLLTPRAKHMMVYGRAPKGKE